MHLPGIYVDEHIANHSEPKILPQCTLPLTGVAVVNGTITELAVMDVTVNGVAIVELAPSVDQHHLADRRGVPLN